MSNKSLVPTSPRFDSDFVLSTECVYVHPGRSEFGYSDGAEVENRMLDILSSASDLSTQSAELQKSITDWGTEYHFSTVRYNLLRHVPFSREHEVLEIGAGCGSISRFLAERCGKLVAVEGSLARARCARTRCRDLDNVEVYCTNLQDFDTERRFDVVTLIGVLEYAPIYISGEDPMLACLEMAAHFLKPDGVLVIAIENQLGLKYLCGYPEDHVSQAYFGVKDLYNGRTARTLGKVEMEALLRRADFQSVEFQYPFPDYKMPSTVFFDGAFEHKRFQPEQILRQLKSRDYTDRNLYAVPDNLLWPAVGRNRLIRDLSNSFLVFASKGQFNRLSVSPDLLAVGYTSDRVSGSNTVKTFKVDGDGEIWVMRSPVGSVEKQALDHISTPERYVNGVHLGAEIARCVDADDWATFIGRVTAWVNFLLSHGVSKSVTPNQLESEIAGDWIDCIPANVILRGSTMEYIDREWHYRAGVVLAGTVVLRFLPSLYDDVTTRHFLSRHLSVSGEGSLRALLDALGLQVTERVVQNYVSVANTINAEVFPHKRATSDAEIWTLLRPEVPPAATPWKRIRSGLRRRMRATAHHLVSAARVWGR